MSPRNSREINNYEKFGLVSSLCVHFCVFAWALFFSRLEIEDIETPIYSVTMEGGKTIGGRMQVAKDEKKTQVAPPKNVAEEWAKWCRNPNYLFDYISEDKTFFNKIKCKITSVSFATSTPSIKRGTPLPPRILDLKREGS